MCSDARSITLSVVTISFLVKFIYDAHF